MQSLAGEWARPEPVLQKMAEGCRASGRWSCVGGGRWDRSRLARRAFAGGEQGGSQLPGFAGRGDVLLAED